MKKAIILVLAVVLAAGLGFFAYALSPDEIEAVERPDPAGFDAGDVARGAELAALGNCLTCHRREGGAAFAGGYAVETPLGAIYGSNITPDEETGIGRWSEAAFLRSMREGIDREGRHLYPAFPYTHFTHVTEDDAQAIYAYLMTRRPVNHRVADPDLGFPFNVRPLLAAWKLLFFEAGGGVVSQDDPIARGRYLVEGLGHCGACHTPRNLFLAEKEDADLQGAHAAGWYNPALAGKTDAPTPWSEGQIATYLQGGFAENHGVAAGPMAEVAAELAKAPQEDVEAMAAYLVSLQDGSKVTRRAAIDEATSGDGTDLGRTLYLSACSHCHREGGDEAHGTPGGSEGLPLSLSTALYGPDGTNLAQFILHGVEPPYGEAGWRMPGFADLLTDDQITAIAAHLRRDVAGLPVWDGFADTVSEARGDRRTRETAGTNGS